MHFNVSNLQSVHFVSGYKTKEQVTLNLPQIVPKSRTLAMHHFIALVLTATRPALCS